MAQLPCDGDGVCMLCKVKPLTEESLLCTSCATPWHVSCLSSPPDSLDATLQWQCPDCSGDVHVHVDPAPESDASVLVAAIRAIEADGSLTEAQKAKKMQQVMSGQAHVDDDEEEKAHDDDEVLAACRENLKCAICIQLLEKPVSTPCGHNFCLKCFRKWVGKKNLTCVKCRHPIPNKMASLPMINYLLVKAIRVARGSKSPALPTPTVDHFVRNEDRPDEPYRTERAIKSGNSNASSGKIFVTTHSHHFGPIPPENDPTRNQGVLVGESWECRLHCRQWGVHLPHVSGIAGQAKNGAQSVVLSVDYVHDEDHGEWFIYTGSGGKDLSGNKRTNKELSKDQKFTHANEALRLSCKMGYPVRVVRSDKAKHSAYAPEKGFRYDGIYRVEKCWRKVSSPNPFKVCRFLFVRCDNDAAPWTSGERGDRPRPLPDIPELKNATNLFVRETSPSWGFDDVEGRWKWMKPPPVSQKGSNALATGGRKNKRKTMGARDKFLKEFSCELCRKIMSSPVTTPCAHNFCKACLEAKFSGIAFMRERGRGGRSLRARKNVMTCPCCPTNLVDFLQNPQVNREMMDLIETLTKKDEKLVVEDVASTGSENMTMSNSGGNTESKEEEDGEEEEKDEDEEEEDDNEEEETQAEPPMKKAKLEH